MSTVDTHDIGPQVTRLVQRAVAGEEILLAATGEVVVKLVPVKTPAAKQPRRGGVLAGKIRMADDFDAPLPGDMLDAFEGQSDPSDEPPRPT